jgi:2-hydroxychromene-2-carboxylate isomerase
MPSVDFWFEFASTYSYPAAMRIGRLAAARGVGVRWRVFLLGPIFKAQGWDSSPFNLYPAKGQYMWRDLERICDGLALPFKRPHPFPQQTLLAARVAIVALTNDWGEDFCRDVYRAEFGGGRDISESQTIADVLEGLGQDPKAMIERAQSDAVRSALREQTEQAKALGLFGAPSVVTADGELFWGNDRLEAALDWAVR